MNICQLAFLSLMFKKMLTNYIFRGTDIKGSQRLGEGLDLQTLTTFEFNCWSGQKP